MGSFNTNCQFLTWTRIIRFDLKAARCLAGGYMLNVFLCLIGNQFCLLPPSYNENLSGPIYSKLFMLICFYLHSDSFTSCQMTELLLLPSTRYSTTSDLSLPPLASPFILSAPPIQRLRSISHFLIFSNCSNPHSFFQSLRTHPWTPFPLSFRWIRTSSS